MPKLSRYEMNLPRRLQEDIDHVNNTDPEEFAYCGYLMELNASINVCEIDESISREQYMLKAPDPSKKYQGNDFFPYTEYMSCKILSSLGLNCQQTLLGEFTLPIDIPEKVEAVACKNFRPNMEEFTPFYNLRNARFYGSSSSNSRSSELSEILATIDTQSYVDPLEIKNFLTEQFVSNTIISNFYSQNKNKLL